MQRSGIVCAEVVRQGAADVQRINVIADAIRDATRQRIVIQFDQFVNAHARAIILEADDRTDIQTGAGLITIAVSHSRREADTTRTKELGFIRITRWVNDGAQLIQLDRACGINAQGKHQLISARGTTLKNTAIQAEQYRLIGSGVHQTRVGVLHGQFVGQALQAIGARLHIEYATEVGAGIHVEVGLINLQR